ncbi:hypothetical protein B9Z65_1030 [Elsinoe australis]|uniref:Uncharacterized protein n=1 Tax=Elsinoe australis TaxID=40998 RepID=A0A2P8AI30_9PEZI|nr:hypothetical protein B9Z65_1030 [Elsinoe australis]
MRVAELLSDLTSLRACDPQAALALVSARPKPKDAIGEITSNATEKEDEDLKRARDLIELHSTVKTRHGNGVDDELLYARHEVRKVLDML